MGNENKAATQSNSNSLTTLMSTAALVISLIAGSYGLYDTLVLRKEKERQDAVSDVRAAVKRITEINSLLLTASSNRPDAAIFIAQITNPEKIALLAFADKTIAELGENYSKSAIDPGTYFLLSIEHLNMANSKLAVKYAEHVVMASGENKALAAEGLRINARALFVPGADQDREQARRIYTKARDLVRNFSSIVSRQVEINIMTDHLVSEANFGECPKAQQLAREIVNSAQGWGVPPQQLQAITNNLKMNSELTRMCVDGFL